jgi:transcriptional regulator with XRE-family HTH domain
MVKEKRFVSIDMEKTGKWLRYICRFKGISVKELCIYLSLGSPQSVYAWFCGRTLPSLDNFYALSQIVSMPLDELIVNQEEMLPRKFCEKVGEHNTRVFLYRIYSGIR